MTAEEAIKICKDAYEKGIRAYLRGADLQRAYLRGADLQRADFQGADLQCADLQHADLRGADFQGADLQCADLRGADLPSRIIQIGPIGSRKSQTVYDATHDFIRCGCFSGTLDDFAAKVSVTHIGNRHNLEYSAMIIFLRTMREIEISSEVK